MSEDRLWQFLPELIDFAFIKKLLLTFLEVKEIELHDAVIEASLLLGGRFHCEEIRLLTKIEVAVATRGMLTIKTAVDLLCLVDDVH